jgi:hypothetical protein
MKPNKKFLKQLGKLIGNDIRLKVGITTNTNYPYMYGESNKTKITIQTDGDCQVKLINKFCDKTGGGIYHQSHKEDGITVYEIGGFDHE